jgi:hypothetical protein
MWLCVSRSRNRACLGVVNQTRYLARSYIQLYQYSCSRVNQDSAPTRWSQVSSAQLPNAQSVDNWTVFSAARVAQKPKRVGGDTMFDASVINFHLTCCLRVATAKKRSGQKGPSKDFVHPFLHLLHTLFDPAGQEKCCGAPH